MEQEIYIEKISNGYNISKEAIYGQVNKLQYANMQGKKILEKRQPVKTKIKKEEENKVAEDIIKRENTIISILINFPEEYKKIKENINIEDIKYEKNQKIIKEIYSKLESEDKNVMAVLDKFEDDEMQSHLTKIMAEDYGIVDAEKAVEDIILKYEREKLEKRRDELLRQEKQEQDEDKKKQLGKEINDIILKLIKIK